MSVGRLLSTAVAMQAAAHPPLAALLDKGFLKAVPVCGYCGQHTVAPCTSGGEATRCIANMDGENDA